MGIDRLEDGKIVESWMLWDRLGVYQQLGVVPPTPELIKQWFAPAPWTTPTVETDVRVGGSNLVVMRSPDGNEFPNRGVYLEVVKNERLVFTDAFAKAWEPSEKPFMTVVLTFEEHDGKTRYTARVHHWTIADREAHEKMGFHPGWAMCAEQLATVVEKL